MNNVIDIKPLYPEPVGSEEDYEEEYHDADDYDYWGDDRLDCGCCRCCGCSCYDDEYDVEYDCDYYEDEEDENE